MIIGITGYYHAPFDIEAEALGSDVEFIDFNSRDEDDFDEDALGRLDALLVYHARITDKTLAAGQVQDHRPLRRRRGEHGPGRLK